MSMVYTRAEIKAFKKAAAYNCRRYSKQHGGTDGHTCIDLGRSAAECCETCRAKRVMETLKK